MDFTIWIVVWHDKCIRTDPSQYGPLGSVHEALKWIQAIHPQSRRGARSSAPNAGSCPLKNKAP